MGNEEGIDEIDGIGPAPVNSVDTAKFNGTKTKIARVSDQTTYKTDYDDDGNFVKDLQREAPCIYVETDVIGEDNAGGPVTVSERFNLKFNKVTEKYEYSLHPKSNVKKFFNKFNINSFKQAIGKDALVVEKVSSTNADFKWLGIQY